MKQLFQNLRDGVTSVSDVPRPSVTRESLQIRTSCSLVSAGTEKMLVEFGRANLLDKARSQPEKVRQVIDKVATDGLSATIDAVRSKLDQPLALGYCNVGVVTEVGSGGSGYRVGDRVVSNGPHAEYVVVPLNLCARIPDSVSDEEATFTVLAAIALQGVRLAEPTLGECYVVIGLGLVGLLTVQILQANGCRVLGMDPDPDRAELARRFGAEIVEPDALGQAEEASRVFSRQRGVDGVLVTAATESSQPISLAARMCRKRGRIVLVGVTGLELNRADFYEKELTFQVSCSYGPGRYDRAYEEQGRDYPVAFVRWTEQRNFEAVLDMMALGRLDVSPLITHRFAFAEALPAYDLLVSGKEKSLGIVLNYTARSDAAETSDATVDLRDERDSGRTSQDGIVTIGAIGAGNYAGRVLIPALAPLHVTLQTIASHRGVTASYFGKKFGFLRATTDVDSVLDDDRINAVVIATRHDSHALLVCRALAAGKHVFVEKPLGLTLAEIDEIETAQAASGTQLCVGFNRRFAPLVQHAAEQVRARSGPLAMVVTVNAGTLPQDHWTRDPRIGGGRILGEGCHFLDLARFLASHTIESVHVTSAASSSSARIEDVSMIQLGFQDGSVASIQYLANGHPRFPKERIELFWDSKVLRIDNFRSIRGWGVASTPFWRSASQDKGHAALLSAFVRSVRGLSPAPIPVEELLEVSRWSVRAGQLALGVETS